MSSVRNWIDLGFTLDQLTIDQAEWSRRTFGSDPADPTKIAQGERGPVGPTKHLAKEVLVEILGLSPIVMGGVLDSVDDSSVNCQDIMEWADVLILWLDATRRSGFTPAQVIDAARKKMAKNKERNWPAPSAENANKPVEHHR